MSDKLPIVVVLPAFNEAERIAPVVRACSLVVDKVLVIDDGSADDTAETARKAGAEVISHPQNQGKGAAIRSAFDAFRRDSLPWLALLDADGQHDPEDIKNLYACAVRGPYDLVLGDRMTDVKKMPFIRICTNRFMSWLISKMAGQWMPDTQCGFRLFSRRLLDSIDLTFTTTHYDLESEILFQVARKGHPIGSATIKTIYQGEPSRINPIVDTVRFFKLVFRYLQK